MLSAMATCTPVISVISTRTGFCFLSTAKKEMIIVGGYNVYPREIDEVLFNHPDTREAATVGRRDDRLGEVVVAFVAVNTGADLDEGGFFAYCKENLLKYKRPVEVVFIDALPRTGTNKIDRSALRAMAAEGRAAIKRSRQGGALWTRIGNKFSYQRLLSSSVATKSRRLGGAAQETARIFSRLEARLHLSTRD
jgi:AMP-binding enzyme C-terminal domain